MKAQKEIKTQGADVGFRYLLVSLFLAVLAFFIVLNSLSVINKEKENEFFDKVQEEFVGGNLENKFKIFIKKKQKKSGGSDNLINIKDVIKDFLVNRSVLIISDFTDYGKILEIKITKGNAFNSNSDYPKTSATKFLKEFAEVLVEQQKMHKFRVMIISGYDQYNPDDLKLNTDRNYALMEKMKYNLKGKVRLDSYLIPYKSGHNELNFIKLMMYLDES